LRITSSLKHSIRIVVEKFSRAYCLTTLGDHKHLEGGKIIDGHLAIPDILVHRRKIDEQNLLAVEVKARRNKSEVERTEEQQLILDDYSQLKVHD
jgi:hypothetical protein